MICVFDAYGTLFDVSAAARTAAEADARLAGVWPVLAEDWRRKQLEYSWLRTVAGVHAEFWTVTRDALDWALEAHGLADLGLRVRLLALYRRLDAYPEVPRVLGALHGNGVPAAILSNGSPEMLADAVASAGIGALLDRVISVEEAGVFKPHRAAYALATAAYGCAAEDVLFVSSNGWDAAGAALFGFRTVWVNRAGLPADRLFAQPQHVVSDLTGLVEIALP